MSDANATILVIDDDPALRESIGRLLRSLDLDTRLFASIAEFLEADPPKGATCLVLDVRLPGRSGLAKGLAFGIACWLAMGLVFFPLIGLGAFAESVGLGFAPALFSLVMILAYSLVLGAIHDAMNASQT